MVRECNAGVDKSEIPGAVMLIGRPGKIAYFEPFGSPMQHDAIFRIASMTKPLNTDGERR
jgi:CubicO group peptidase (beta-lactamase class C family)